LISCEQNFSSLWICQRGKVNPRVFLAQTKSADNEAEKALHEKCHLLCCAVIEIQSMISMTIRKIMLLRPSMQLIKLFF